MIYYSPWDVFTNDVHKMTGITWEIGYYLMMYCIVFYFTIIM